MKKKDEDQWECQECGATTRHKAEYGGDALQRIGFRAS